MTASHVGHDCDVGDDVTLAENVALGGHVSVGSKTFFGGNSAVHQFVRVGESVMVGGVSGVANDVIPFGFASGQHATLEGLNVVGLRSSGISRRELHQLRRAFRSLFLGDGVLGDRIERVASEFADDPLVQKIVAFVRAGDKRPLMLPRRR
jgi:UDP-N-acetylglucosamine acyltransferase